MSPLSRRARAFREKYLRRRSTRVFAYSLVVIGLTASVQQSLAPGPWWRVAGLALCVLVALYAVWDRLPEDLAELARHLFGRKP